MTPYTTSSTSDAARLPTLTGLRFIAAGSVFLFHIVYTTLFASDSAHQTYATIFGQAGFSSVSFFFVLSGFVLTTAARPESPLAFWRRRALKIYPNHVVTFIVAALLLMSVGQAIVTGPAVTNLLLVQAWVPKPEYLLNLNNVSWSLACEVLFYLAFPLLYRLVVKIRPERLWAWAIGMVAVAALAPVVAGLLLPAEPAWGNAAGGLYRFWFLYMFPPMRLFDFVLGMLLARVLLTGRRVPLSLGGAVALAVTAYALAPLVPPPFALVAVTLGPLGLVVLAAGRVRPLPGVGAVPAHLGW